MERKRQNRRTSGGEGFRSGLAAEVRKRQRRADTLQAPKGTIYHRRLARPKAEACIICLAPFFVEDTSAGGGVGASDTLRAKSHNWRNVCLKVGAHALILLGDVNQTKFQDALKEPCPPV